MVRKFALVLAGLVALVVVAFGAVVLVLQTGAASERVKNLVVPRVSAALGRDVTVESAKLRVLPNPRVALAGTTIAGRPGEPPLARLQSLDVQLGLWPLLRSLGKEVRVDGVTLVKPEVNLVRAKDGTWNYEGLGSASKEAAPKDRATPPADASAGAKVFVAKARIEDGALRFVDASQGRHDAAVALTKIDLDAEGGLGERLAANLTAALASDQKNVSLELSSPRLPEQLAPGIYPELAGRLRLTGIPLQRLRGLLPANVAQMFTGGRVDTDAKVSSEPRGAAYRIEWDGKLAELKLRGEPASGSFALHGRVEPASGSARLEITKLAVKGPGVDLGGTASLDAPKGAPVRARFAIAGPLLDLGAVLGLVPQGPKPAAKPPPTDGALLPPEMARQVEQVDVRGTLDIARVVNGKLAASDVKADAILKAGVFTLERASAGLYGGKLDASGTTVDLADPNPRWNLKARLDAVDLAQAFAAVTGASPLAGKATGALDLAGVGSNWDQVKRVVTGLAALSLKEGALTTKDLGGDALGAVAQGLQKLGRGNLAGKVGALENGKTTLRDLAASFSVKDGFLALSKPLAFTTPAGAARLGGKIGLSEELALEGGLTLTKEVLARAGLPLPGGVELPMKLGGTLGAPAPSFDATAAVGAAAKGFVASKKQELQDQAQKQARKGAEDLLRRLGR